MHPDLLLEMTQWDTTGLPPDVAVVDRPGVTYLSSPRVNNYNKVVRLRAADDELPDIVAEVRAAHEGRRSRWQVYPSIWRPALERALSAAGYAPGDVSNGFTCPAASAPPAAPGLVTHRVETLEELRAWHRVLALAFDSTWQPHDEDLQVELGACADPAGRAHRFLVLDDRTGEAVSAGSLDLFTDLGVGLLRAGCTVPGRRHQGGYSESLRARMLFARDAGCARVGLYALRETSAPIIERMGWQRHGEMTYWVRPTT